MQTRIKTLRDAGFSYLGVKENSSELGLAFKRLLWVNGAAVGIAIDGAFNYYFCIIEPEGSLYDYLYKIGTLNMNWLEAHRELFILEARIFQLLDFHCKENLDYFKNINSVGELQQILKLESIC